MGDKRLYASLDFGMTWLEAGSPWDAWAVASSGDGTRLVALSRDGSIRSASVPAP
jgi:hypothetical protein